MAIEEQIVRKVPVLAAALNASEELSTSATASTSVVREAAMIHVEGLKRNFGQFEAVKDISFDVYPGEIFGFLGPNGAGKSTTINMLCTLLKPTGGSASIAGYDIVAQRNEVREAIGLTSQDPSLDDRLTADENLRFHATVYGVSASISKERSEELLKMVDLYERRNSLVRTFSGGMKRRLEIARSLLHSPQVLFLDEPTIGLDPQTRLHLWTYILQLRQKRQMTMLLTTHYMEEAEHCDRIAIVDHGTVVALDTPAHLKGMVGGDVIRLKTSDNATAIRQIEEHFGVSPREHKGELIFEIADGEELVPRIVEKISVRIASISVRRPTLDDVFIKLTGRAIREEEADGKDQARSFMRKRGWRS